MSPVVLPLNVRHFHAAAFGRSRLSDGVSAAGRRPIREERVNVCERGSEGARERGGEGAREHLSQGERERNEGVTRSAPPSVEGQHNTLTLSHRAVGTLSNMELLQLDDEEVHLLSSGKQAAAG